MTYLQALILGIIQGITEFLPISSSGHLVIAPFLLGWELPEEQIFPFDVLVQFSTLFALLIYYRRDIIQIVKKMISGIKTKDPFGTVEAKVGWLTLLATIPAGLIGLLLKEVISDAFTNPRLAAASLLFTAILLFLSEKFGKKNRDIDQLNWKDAIAMGGAQALAVFPGISRSGSTISGGLGRNLHRKTAGQFAFLMAIPIMAAAGFLSLFDLLKMTDIDGFFGIMAVGFFTAGIVGFFSIKWLLKYINNHSLVPFALYCALVGTGTLAISFYSTPTSVPVADIANEETAIIVSFQSPAGWLVPAMNICSEQTEQETAILLKNTDSNTIPDDASVHLSYGELLESAQYVYQIGSDQIVFAAGMDSPLVEIPFTSVENIFSGKGTNFQDLAAACPECELNDDANIMINTWGYPAGSTLQLFVDRIFSNRNAYSGYIAPTPVHMVQILKKDPASIGYLPLKYMDEQLKIISPAIEAEADLSIPILASAHQAPNKRIQEWLSCLQREIKN